jgi:hypothetical protein
MLGHNNVNEEIDRLVNESTIVDYKFTLVIQCEIKSAYRDLSVSVNDDVVFEGAVKSGRYELSKEIKILPGQKAIIKAKSNTHKHGDKIIVDQFHVNGVSIKEKHQWVLDQQKFTHIDGKIEMNNNGIYHNGTWSLELHTPIFPWLFEHSVTGSEALLSHKKNTYKETVDDLHYKVINTVFR